MILSNIIISVFEISDAFWHKSMTRVLSAKSEHLPAGTHLHLQQLFVISDESVLSGGHYVHEDPSGFSINSASERTVSRR